MQDIVCEKIRELPFQVIFGLFFGFFLAQTSAFLSKAVMKGA